MAKRPTTLGFHVRGILREFQLLAYVHAPIVNRIITTLGN